MVAASHRERKTVAVLCAVSCPLTSSLGLMVSVSGALCVFRSRRTGYYYDLTHPSRVILKRIIRHTSRCHARAYPYLEAPARRCPEGQPAQGGQKRRESAHRS